MVARGGGEDIDVPVARDPVLDSSTIDTVLATRHLYETSCINTTIADFRGIGRRTGRDEEFGQIRMCEPLVAA